MAGKKNKKYATLAVREWCEDLKGCPFETTAAAILNGLPHVTYSSPCDEYRMEINNCKDLSLYSTLEFRPKSKKFFSYDNVFALPQLSAPDNPLYKEHGVYEIDGATASVLTRIYKDGEKAMKEVEEEIKMLAAKHLKIALMTNSSMANVIKAKGRKLTDDELKERIDE